MPSGSCTALSDLPEAQTGLLVGERRGVLSTVGDDGFPHSVPVAYVIHGDVIVTPIDGKPKSSKELIRVKNIAARPSATLLVDHWDEDWKRLGWVMVRAEARIVPRVEAERALRARYPQYETETDPGERSIVLTPQRISWWSWE